MTTKRDIINGAFEELGLGEGYDATPEDYSTALTRLDDMMAEWGSFGIPIGYPITSNSQVATIDNEVATPIPLIAGIKAALAIRLAPGFGKTPSPDTKRAARSGWNTAMRLGAVPPQKQINTSAVPAGAGNKPGQYRRFLNQDGPVEIITDGKLP